MDDFAKLRVILQTLGDTSRLKIINFIGETERSVSEIVGATGLSQPLVSHHLKSMRDKLILETNRSGPFIYYKLKDQRLLSALGIILDIVRSYDTAETDSPMFCSPPWWKSYWNSKLSLSIAKV